MAAGTVPAPVPRLVPLPAEPTDAFVDELRRTWDRGDAVLPLDPRLPDAARQQLVDALLAGEDVEPGDALVVATSGTSGAPKGAVLTHDALAASAAATSSRLAVDPTADRWLACLPLAHVGGLGVVVRACLTGTPLVVRPSFEGATTTGATLVSVVRTHVVRSPEAVASYRVALLGGGTPPPDRPANVVATYGMTETGGGVVYDGVPLDGVEVRADADGQLHVRGSMLMRGYRDGTTAIDADGWLATGDAGAVDGGIVRVRGRVGDVIVTGGEKVWPDVVEAVLREMPGVGDVAVVGRPDPEWGQAVVAVVDRDPAVDAPSLDALRSAVKERVGPWAAPKDLVLVDALPRTSLGKVHRSAVRPSLPD